MIFSKKTYLLCLSAVIILIVISYFTIDKEVARYFLAEEKTYEHLGDIISISGESHWYIATGILGWAFFKYKKQNTLYANRFLFLLYSNLFSGLVSLILKNIFGRVRPWELKDNGDEFGFLLFKHFDAGIVEKFKIHFTTILDAPTTYASFPSGHTTTIFAFFTYISIFFPKYIYLWLSIAIFAASGRILASDHFVSDILAGACVGTISTMFIYSKMKTKLGIKL